MHAEAQRRLGHALQAIRSIQTYTADAPFPECLADDLTRSAVERQLGIVQEALRVALVEEPSLRHTWPDVDALLAGCARMRDWEHPVALADLVGFVEGDLKVWQESLQQDEGAKLDQQIAENLRGWDMSFEATYKVADLIASSKLWIGDGYRAKNSELGSSGIPFARAGDSTMVFTSSQETISPRVTPGRQATS